MGGFAPLEALLARELSLDCVWTRLDIETSTFGGGMHHLQSLPALMALLWTSCKIKTKKHLLLMPLFTILTFVTLHLSQ